MLSLDPADTYRFYLRFHYPEQETPQPPLVARQGYCLQTYLLPLGGGERPPLGWDTAPRFTRVDLYAHYLDEALREAEDVFDSMGLRRPENLGTLAELVFVPFHGATPRVLVPYICSVRPWNERPHMEGLGHITDRFWWFHRQWRHSGEPAGDTGWLRPY